MKIKSYYNKLLFVTMVFFTASIFFSTTAKAANSWTNRQEKAHEIAELARAIGLPETDPIIKRAQELWWDEIGANTDRKSVV